MSAIRAMMVALSLSALILLFLTAWSGGGERVVRSIEVVVEPGDTLWSIAVCTAPRTDPRRTVDEIVSLNRLKTMQITPGQRLVVKDRRQSSYITRGFEQEERFLGENITAQALEE